MDYQLVLLLAVMVLALAVGIKSQLWWFPGDPRYQYRRVFSAGAAGLLFLITGLIGRDLRYSHGWLQGTTWADAPIWWQVGLGAGFLLLAGFWAARVATPSEPGR